jgi:hypothetical protein
MLSDFGRLLRTTAWGIALMASIGLSIGVTASYHHEHQRADYIPLAFSEMSQIERDAHYAGKNIGPMTRFLTQDNDLDMKIFEAWNGSHHNKDTARNFATELEFHVEPTYKFHKYELPQLFQSVPQAAQEALDELRPFIAARDGIKGPDQEFRASWDEDHTDYYRPEHYTEEEVIGHDKNGRDITRTVDKTRQVYDHTVHDYDYHRGHGEAASQQLDKLLQSQPRLELAEQLQGASQTNAEGEYAADTSRPQQKRLSADQYRVVADSWKTGSTLNQNLKDIYRDWTALSADAGSWRSAKTTAHSESYTTSSHSDSGPREFRVAQQALGDGTDLDSSITEVVSGIEQSKANVPALEAKIKQLIAVALDHQKGADANKLTREVLSMAKDDYTRNFKAGVEVDRFRAGFVALFGFLGALGGGLFAAACKWSADKFGWPRWLSDR